MAPVTAHEVTDGLNAIVQDMRVRSNGDIVVSMSANGINPNPYTQATQQSIAQFDASGNGPTATVSIEYPSPTASSLDATTGSTCVFAALLRRPQVFPVAPSAR